MPLEPATAAMIEAARQVVLANPALPALHDLPVAEARAGYAARYRARGAAADPAVAEAALNLDGVPARLFTPPASPRALLIYFHGGGYVVGGGDAYAPQSSALAAAAQVAVLLPDVRLAPEHPHPAPAEDAARVVRAARAHPRLRGLKALAGGDSAGGALALVAALSVPQALHGLALAYPWADARPYRGGAPWPSIAAFGQGFWLDTATMEWFARAMWPDAAQAAEWRASPLLAPSFAVLPPVRITVADHDPLLDPTLALSGRLLADGVDTRLRIERGLVHNFLGHAAVSAAARAAFARFAADVAELAG
jgi:acetyl esterase